MGQLTRTRAKGDLHVRETYSAVYVINIVFQAIFTLLWNIGLALLVGWALVRWASLPEWIYVPLIVAGVISGFFSMIKFILSAMKSLDRIEEERRQKIKSNGRKNGHKE